MDYPQTKQDFVNEKKRYLMQIGDELGTQQALVPTLIQRLEEFGFIRISVACDIHGWELNVARGTNQSCRSPRHFKKLIEKLVAGLNRSIDSGLVLAVVQGEHLAAAFRLQRTVAEIYNGSAVTTEFNGECRVGFAA